MVSQETVNPSQNLAEGSSLLVPPHQAMGSPSRENAKVQSICLPMQLGGSHHCEVVLICWYLLLFFFFVFETIRTSAMRVIHITVKTNETQRLRIKFVLVLSYLNSTQHLSTICTVLSYLSLQTQASLPFQLSIKSKFLATNSVNKTVILTTNKSTILHCQCWYLVWQNNLGESSESPSFPFSMWNMSPSIFSLVFSLFHVSDRPSIGPRSLPATNRWLAVKSLSFRV